MSRYIDVSNLDIPSDENDYDELVAFADKIAEMIVDAPSIDIVFCKDCLKHKVVPFGENACFYWCDFRCHAVNADGFCSFGESKEGE